MNEIQVKEQATTLEQQARAYTIATNEDYEQAAEFLKRVKGAKKQVEDYWREPIQKAFEAHRALTTKRQQMIGVCESAEKVMKRKMLDYSTKIEAERRAAEEQARKAAQEESDRLLAEAAKAEELGDSASAIVNMAMAEQVSTIAPAVHVAAPKVTGVSTKKVWKVRVDDAKAVPAYVSGVCVRPIDERALLQLRKLNPGIEIPGVTFFQTEQLAIR